MRVEEPVAPGGEHLEVAATTEAEERISVAPQWQLMWWRFRKHKLALLSTALVIGFYLVVAFADFLAYADPQASEAQRSLIAPQAVHLFDDGHFGPYVEGLVGTRDALTFKRVYVADPTIKVPLTFLAQCFEY
jgi:peptide/nickel transport system permease protein